MKKIKMNPKNKSSESIVDKAKKVAIGSLAVAALLTGGVGSCHYSMSHYHYAQKNYRKSLYHAYRASEHFPPYTKSYLQHVLNIMVDWAYYNYTSPSDYYKYYFSINPRSFNSVMYRSDNRLVGTMQLWPKYANGKSVEAAFIRMHGYGYLAEEEYQSFTSSKNQVLATKRISGIKYPKLIRHFTYMRCIDRHILQLALSPNWNIQDDSVKKMGTILEHIIEAQDPLLSEKNHLLYLEYGLICSKVIERIDSSIKGDQKELIKGQMHDLLNLVDKIQKEKLPPYLNKSPGLQTGITYMRSTIDKYKKTWK